MKIGDTVQTEFGAGVIADIEHYNRLQGGINRYGIKLQTNPFRYNLVYFWPEEVKPVAPSN